MSLVELNTVLRRREDMRFVSNALIATALACAGVAAPGQGLAQTMTGLGDLPGGNFYSIAKGISADGSVIVGVSHSDKGQEAFRWTKNGGMQGVGDLQEGGFRSEASAVSADG
jgi:probable HAF family extracellular repeat protein